MSTEALNNEKAAHTTTPQTNPPSSWPHDAEKAAGQTEQNGPPQHAEQKATEHGPAGGFDATAIPSRPAGYTLKITIHRATNLPMADINSFSSDPYVLAQIDSETPTRHKEDPPVRHRTQTIRQNTEPVWNDEWIVANVPASGMKLKLRVYDEDPADKDDRLGNVHVHVDRISDEWVGLKEQSYEMKARMASKRAYLIRMAAVCMRTSKHLRGNLFVSIENLGRTQQDGQNGRIYTVGPCRWVRHYDPILGRIMGMKEPDEDGDEPKQVGEKQQKQQESQKRNSGPKDKKKVQKYNFQANQMQLQGPVPAHLYHRYVEFKPFVKGMFTGSGVRGFILSKALHHQHARVYNFDRQTIWGNYTYPQNGQDESMTKQFLDLVHYDKGGRIFTYVLTLDALWRFTETGKEFGIDMLSKHTMHSDVSIYIAFSGEFFVRRLKHPRRPPPPDPIDSSSNIDSPEHRQNDWHPPNDVPGGPPREDEEPPKDPAYYELVIDNDSGTYRPNAKLLPLLKEFLTRALPGIHIQTLDCQADAEKMSRMKDEQRERKKKEGDNVIYMQGSRSSSISSSDEEDLDRMQAEFEGGTSGHGHDDGVVGQAARDAKLKQQARWRKAKGQYKGNARNKVDAEDEGFGDEEGGAQAKGGAGAAS
ncbi:hypothetical protein LTR10_009723 [Elasticomyces elasticus]|nr:hypothetical protein LTR10_009723 [Elasticomyces elasticus]KAK4970012.1 hypothetical protein LTR42_008179 [Elasticomyces elasticus]